MDPCVDLFGDIVQCKCICEVSCVRELWGQSDRFWWVLGELIQSCYSSLKKKKAISQSGGADIEGFITSSRWEEFKQASPFRC